jgi:hypothetical protein
MPTTARPDSQNGQATDTDEATEPEMVAFEVPSDLTALDDATLESLTTQTRQAIEVARQVASPSADDLAYLTEVSSTLKALKAERTRRDAQHADLAAQYAAMLEDVDPPAANDQGESGDQGADGSDDGDGGSDTGDGSEGGEAAAEGSDAAAAPRSAVTIQFPRDSVPRLNPTLAEIEAQRRADGYNSGLEDVRPEVVITAAADVPRRSSGERLETIEDLVDACIARSRALGVTQGAPAFTPLASVRRSFPLTIDERMHPDAVRQSFEQLVQPHLANTQAFEALIAAGGWCAPSEIRYEFFRVSEVAGLLDLPTFGVNRGGIRWPQSLSLADFFALSGAPASGVATNATMPWQWTEADDIAATGESPSKVCLRPPCPGFDEARLRAFGICVLAGNLTMDAFPELIRHFIAQTMVAHARVMNRSHILQVVAGSTATTPTSSATQSPTTHVLGGYELNAIDYRERHGMAPTAVLEGVLPSWFRGVMRSDLAKRNALGGPEALRVADAELMRFFDERRIRMQWVQDWQTRLATGIAPVSGTPPTNWPTTVDGLLFAPGTWGRGNGMILDLGVVRDSVLNASNDHTAAWSEEATLIAKFGHESRVITFNNVIANGASGSQQTPTDP